MKEIRVTAHGADILPIDALIEFQGNLKTITRSNLDKLKRSILKHGFTAPIFVWKGVDNHILDGHQRLKALIEMRQEGYNIPLLPVVYIDADSEAHAKEKLLYITSQYGDFTTEGFAEFVSELDFDFDDIRLTDGEFSIDFGQAEETTGDDDAPEVAEGEPDSKLGEIYELGPHRLMCGDSTDAEQVARLMGGEKPDMVFTDPPYGFNYTKKSDGTSISNDGFEFEQVIADALALVKVDTAYVCGDAKTARAFLRATSCLGEPKNCIVWVKPIQHRMHRYEFCHELIWFWGDNGNPFYGKNIFEAKREIQKFHPTIKPVELVEYCLASHKNENIVLDQFGGSGTTLIACAKTNRQCRMMELDPQYCDVIRRRWTKWARENGKEVGTGGLEPMEI